MAQKWDEHRQLRKRLVASDGQPTEEQKRVIKTVVAGYAGSQKGYFFVDCKSCGAGFLVNCELSGTGTHVQDEKQLFCICPNCLQSEYKRVFCDKGCKRWSWVQVLAPKCPWCGIEPTITQKNTAHFQKYKKREKWPHSREKLLHGALNT
ncbi:MAG: hypothetical protein IID34_15510 [Planctomycetes bacterium]|nr:hypothetical protein [Planctomycetota bacterium]